MRKIELKLISSCKLTWAGDDDFSVVLTLCCSVHVHGTLIKQGFEPATAGTTKYRRRGGGGAVTLALFVHRPFTATQKQRNLI